MHVQLSFYFIYLFFISLLKLPWDVWDVCVCVCVCVCVWVGGGGGGCYSKNRKKEVVMFTVCYFYSFNKKINLIITIIYTQLII